MNADGTGAEWNANMYAEQTEVDRSITKIESALVDIIEIEYAEKSIED